MTLGQILNDIQAGNDLTEEQLLDTEVVFDLGDTTGTFRATGTKVLAAKMEHKMVWSCMRGELIPDPKYPIPRIVLKGVLTS